MSFKCMKSFPANIKTAKSKAIKKASIREDSLEVTHLLNIYIFNLSLRCVNHCARDYVEALSSLSLFGIMAGKPP